MSTEAFDRIMVLNAEGRSQTEIAAEVGYGLSTVNRVVHGKTTRPVTCPVCGKPTTSVTGTCNRRSNPECVSASHHIAYMARTEGVIRTQACPICGRPMKMNNKYGICNRKDNPGCVKAHNAARHAAHPEHNEQQLRYRSAPAVWCRSQITYLRGRDLLIDLDVPYLLEQWGDGHCPVCRTEYAVGDTTSRAVSPSMDRVYVGRGYRKGNVRIICMRCNRRKNDMSGAELLALAQDTLRAEAWADGLLAVI